MDFLDELQHRTLPADGAMGTELLAAGVPPTACLEELCVSQPEVVQGVHQRSIAAGARLIETNSFGANAVRLARHGLEGRVNEINWSAAQLAREVAKGTGVYVAGSVGPLGITAAQAEEQGIDRHEVFLEQIGALLDGGCNLIVLETFLDVEEMLIALNAKHTLHHCPVVALLVGDEPTALAAAVEKLRAADADVVGLNCVDGARALALLGALPDPGPLAAFPSAGLPQNRAGQLHYPATPEQFAAHGLALAAQGVRLIGGCCGVGPAHIAALAKAVQEAAAPR
jgi:homocysteine S-methyltransferase